jgi:hypothetical protein
MEGEFTLGWMEGKTYKIGFWGFEKKNIIVAISVTIEIAYSNITGAAAVGAIGWPDYGRSGLLVAGEDECCLRRRLQLRVFLYN